MADIKLIGAVGVKVRAVTDGFRQDTKRGVERELATYDPKVNVSAKVRADTSDARREIRRLEQDARNIRVNAKVDVDNRKLAQANEAIGKLRTSLTELRRQSDQFRRTSGPLVDFSKSGWQQGLNDFEQSLKFTRAQMKGLAEMFRETRREVKESGFSDAQKAIDKMTASQQKLTRTRAADAEEIRKLESRIKSLTEATDAMMPDPARSREEIQSMRQQIGLLTNKARALRHEERQLGRLRDQWEQLDRAQRSAVQATLQSDENVLLGKQADEFLRWKNTLDEMSAAQLANLRKIETEEVRLNAIREQMDSRLARRRASIAYEEQRNSVEFFNDRAEREKALHEQSLAQTDELWKRRREARQAEYDQLFNAVDLDELTAGYLRKIRGDARDNQAWVHMSVDVDDETLREAKHKAQRLHNDIEGMTAKMEVEPTGLMAMAAQLKYASRDRFVNFYVQVNQTSLAVAEGMLKSLAGLNTTRSIGMALQELATNFDNVAVKTSTVSTVVGNLVNVLGSAASSIFAVAGDLLQLTGLLATVPAATAAATAGIFLMKMGWEDFVSAAKGDADALAALPANARAAAQEFTGLYDSMQKEVQSRYWDGIGDSMLNLAQNVLPEVRRGLNESAEAAGRFAGGVFDSFNKIALNGDMRVMFANLSGMFDEMAGAAEPLFDAVNRIGLRGSEYLPRFGEWVTEISEGFRDWATAADEAGKFNTWIEQGITQLQTLGRMSADTVRIISGLGRIGMDAGSQGLAGWADGLDRIAQTVNSEPFRSRLATILNGTIEGTSILSDGFKNLSSTIGESADWMRELLTVAGELGGGVLDGLSNTIGNIKFQSGVLEGFEGMRDLIEDIQPGFIRLGDLIGSTMRIAGSALSGIAPIINTIVGALADMAENVEEAFVAFSPVLTNQLNGSLTGLAAVLDVVTNAVGGVLEVFTALPAEIQSVIVAFGAFQLMRGQLGSFMQRAFDRTPIKRWREEMMVARAVAGQPFPTTGISNFAVVTDRASKSVQNLRTQMTSLRGVGGVVRSSLGGVVSLLGGPWGLAIGGAVAALSIFAQRSADAKAMQQELAASLDQVTGAATEQTRTILFDQLSEGINRLQTDMDKLEGTSYGAEALDNMGMSVAELTELFASGGERARDFVGDLNHLAQFDTNDEMRAAAESVGFIGDASQMSAADVQALNKVIQKIAPDLLAEGDKIRNRQDALGLKGAADEAADGVDGFTRTFENVGGAIDGFNDQASTAEQRIQSLSDAFDILNGDDTAETMRRTATRAFSAVQEELDRLNESGGIQWSNLYDGDGGFDTSFDQGLKFAELAEQQAEGYVAKLGEYQTKLEEGVFSNDKYQESVRRLFEEIGTSGDQAAEQLGLTGEEARRFAEAWEAAMPDQETWEIVLETRGSEAAAADIEHLKGLGLILTEAEYQMHLDADDNGAINAIERTSGLGVLFGMQVYQAMLDGDDTGMQQAYVRAANAGVTWDGSKWISTLDADGQPTQAAINAARSLGITWDGSKWVATADMDPTEARNGAAAAQAAGTGFGRETFTAIADIANRTSSGLDSAIGSAMTRWAGRVFTATAEIVQNIRTGTEHMDGSLPNSRFKPRITQFMDGGLSAKPQSAHIAKDGSYVLYAEKGTGDEAFIPLAASKRARSLAIWKETGRRLNAYQDGGIRSSMPTPVGSTVNNISVTRAGATGSDVAQALNYYSRRTGRK